jgi:hypothetical protein
MAFTSPPPVVTALRDALVACASWTPGTGAIHYPEEPSSIAPLFAVLAADNKQGTIAIYSTGAVGALQELAYALQYELLSRNRTAGTGLVIVAEPTVSEVTELSAFQEAGGDSYRSLEITVDFGLNL